MMYGACLAGGLQCWCGNGGWRRRVGMAREEHGAAVSCLAVSVHVFEADTSNKQHELSRK